MCTHTDPEVLFATIRHDTLNRMVYLWDGSIDRVLYDYNSIAVWQPYPNTYNNPMYPNLKVLAKDSLLLNGSYYKRWILGMSNGGVISDSNFVSVIEGIATTFGIKAPLVPVFENQEELSCFTLHNVNIYPNISYNCDTALQIAEVAEPASFTISPNPAKDMIRITAEVSDSKYKAEVLDMAGRVVLSFTVNAFPCDLKVEDLKTGTYFLKISSERQSSFARFIKM